MFRKKKILIFKDINKEYFESIEELHAKLQNKYEFYFFYKLSVDCNIFNKIEKKNIFTNEKNLLSFLDNNKNRKIHIILDLQNYLDTNKDTFFFLNYNHVELNILNLFYEEKLKKILINNKNNEIHYLLINKTEKKLYFYIKQIIDPILAILIVLILSPLIFIITILVFIDFKKNPIFTQRRVGYKGKEFTIYKFRTMEVHEDDSNNWPNINYDKISNLGKFLRESGLDELPQLFNVIKGDMNLVGPRPARFNVVQHHENLINLYKIQKKLKPGITGLSQINQGIDKDNNSIVNKTAFNCYYFLNLKFYLDLEILIKTFFKIITFSKN